MIRLDLWKAIELLGARNSPYGTICSSNPGLRFPVLGCALIWFKPTTVLATVLRSWSSYWLHGPSRGVLEENSRERDEARQWYTRAYTQESGVKYVGEVPVFSGPTTVPLWILNPSCYRMQLSRIQRWTKNWIHASRIRLNCIEQHVDVLQQLAI